MKGLILKDLMNLKKQAYIYLALVLFYAVFALVYKNSSFFGGMLCILSAMTPITAMAYDERANWDKYALTMPVSRRDIVLSRYLLGLLCATAAFVLLVLFQTLIPYKEEGMWNVSLIFYAISIVYISLLLPILFWLGVEKGRLLMMLFLLIPILIGFLAPNIDLSALDAQNLLQIVYAFPIFVAVLFLLSLFLSLRIYQRKEL